MSTNPIVVMDTKLHQNPSSTPEIKGRGNWSEFGHVS